MKETRKSTQIALGGVFSALCLLIMFLTGLIPFGTYAFPALAGAMLIAVVEENGSKVAMMVYVSVSLLSLFIVPDREASMMFIAFFGYYPVLKLKLEKIRWKPIQLITKLAIFNAMIVAAYSLMIFVLGMPDIIDDIGELGKFAVVIMLAAGSVVFLIYDVCLTKYTQIYRLHFRQKLLRH